MDPAPQTLIEGDQPFLEAEGTADIMLMVSGLGSYPVTLRRILSYAKTIVYALKLNVRRHWMVDYVINTLKSWLDPTSYNAFLLGMVGYWAYHVAFWKLKALIIKLLAKRKPLELDYFQDEGMNTQIRFCRDMDVVSLNPTRPCLHVKDEFQYYTLPNGLFEYHDLKSNLRYPMFVFNLGSRGSKVVPWKIYMFTDLANWFLRLMSVPFEVNFTISMGFVKWDYTQQAISKYKKITKYRFNSWTPIPPTDCLPLELIRVRRDRASITKAGRNYFVSWDTNPTYVSIPAPLFDRMLAQREALTNSTIKAMSVSEKDNVFQDYEWYIINAVMKSGCDLSFPPTFPKLEPLSGVPAVEAIDEDDDDPDSEINTPTVPQTAPKANQIVGENEPLNYNKPWVFIHTKALEKGEQHRMLGKFISNALISPSWGLPIKTDEGIRRMCNLRYEKYPQLWDPGHEKYFILLMDVFIDKFLSVGKVTKADPEQLYANQTRPSQKSVLERGGLMNIKFARAKEGFIKVESYPEPKPLRPIITANETEKEPYSLATLGLANYIKSNPNHFHWYGFGDDLPGIASRIAAKAEKAKTVGETDFSAFDVTVNNLCRYLERKLLWAAYQEPEVIELHASQLDNKLFFRGVEVEAHFVKSHSGRHSGSPETSLFNSVINAFVAFCVNWEQYGGDPELAWANLGMYGGDDGVTFDADPELYKNICSALGLTIKLSVIERPNKFNFLSREFCDAWAGHQCNHAVISRAVGHMHITASHADFTNAEFLRLKALSYRFTDGTHPVMGPLTEKILMLTAPLKDEDMVIKLAGMNVIDTSYQGHNLKDMIGSWGCVQNTMCDSCIHVERQHWAGTSDYGVWLNKLYQCDNVGRLPCLRMEVMPIAWSSEWSIAYLKHIDDDSSMLLWTKGSLDPLPVYKKRVAMKLDKAVWADVNT